MILLITPDDFTRQGRASGWERVKQHGVSTKNFVTTVRYRTKLLQSNFLV